MKYSRKQIFNIITNILVLAFMGFLSVGIFKSVFNSPTKQYQESVKRIELQFSETELQIFQIEKDVKEIGSRIDSLEQKIDKLFYKPTEPI